MARKRFNIPNILTISRIALIPVIVATFFFKTSLAAWVGCGLFAIAAITDYFDGYLARRWNNISKFGRFLDPIADKLLVVSVLLMLAYAGTLTETSIFPALIILCREILVSGLREFLAGLSVSVPVTQLAKWKTVLQLIALPVLIAAPAIGDPGRQVGEGLLWAAAVLTLISGYDYLRAGLKHMD